MRRFICWLIGHSPGLIGEFKVIGCIRCLGDPPCYICWRYHPDHDARKREEGDE